ncbi:tachylectin-related carbohydrate-binding protein [Streptomyces roseolus]|uniref:tachylectin-related carbohydrate-binding protein n=1 Tax=Streptomyces roseolus TaxID=67358 RepID=UPI0033DAF658
MKRTRRSAVAATALLAGVVPLVLGGAPAAMAETVPVVAEAAVAAEVGTIVQEGGRTTVPSGTEGPVTLRFTATPAAGTTGPLTARVRLPITDYPAGGWNPYRLSDAIDSTCSAGGGAFRTCTWLTGDDLNENFSGLAVDFPAVQVAGPVAYAVTLDLPEGLEWIGSLDAPVTLKDSTGTVVAEGKVGIDVVKGSAYRPLLFGRDRDGVLWSYKGTGDPVRPLDRKVRVGGGWQQYTAIVPLDETGTNGRGDVVARDRDGVLWFYEGVPHNQAAPFKPRVRIGGGWNKYTALAGRDGGLVARDTGGVLWNYVRNAETHDFVHPLLKPRVAVGGGWNTYDTLTALGGGALGRDKAGVLWAHDPDGSASPQRPYDARVKVGGGWQVYTAIAGTGDLQGGNPDVVARDAEGRLWLYAGRLRDGALQPASSRTLIGGGWNTYDLIF